MKKLLAGVTVLLLSPIWIPVMLYMGLIYALFNFDKLDENEVYDDV